MSDALTEMSREDDAYDRLPAVARAWLLDRDIARHRRAIARIEEERDDWIATAIVTGQTEHITMCGTVRLEPGPDGRPRIRLERYPDPPPACLEEP